MRYFLIAAAAILATCPLLADELSDARAALEAFGVRASAAGIVVAKEAELTKELGKAAGLKRNVLQAEKELNAAEFQLETFQRGLTQLRQQHVQLNAQLANINPNDIALNNKLVSAIKVIEGQFDLATDRRDELDAQAKKVRAKANDARESYISLAVLARRLAEDIEKDYTILGANPAVPSAVARYNKAASKQFTFAASPAFQANLRRLKQLEDTVLSDSIDLRDDGSGTMRLNVVVNGRHQQEMMLDSGASLISLSASVAAKFGIKPGEKDPKIVLQLADGREIGARLMKLASVRVGKFQVDNVECAVLGDEAVAAEPLLGMSFLEHFKFEIDAASKKLTMVKVAGTDAGLSKK